MKRPYRYRDHSGGITRISRERLHHLTKIGRIHTIRGYRYKSKWGDREAVLIKGTLGSARYEGFLWSYIGEGPSGLVECLKLCGAHWSIVDFITFGVKRREQCGVDWELKIDKRGNVNISIPSSSGEYNDGRL